MTPDISTFSQIGIAGFAIWIMWRMYDSSVQERVATAARFKEKDQEAFAEIDKRDKRNEESQRIFQDFATKTHDSMSKQINENTKALTTFTTAVQENIKVLNKVNDHLNMPHTNPVFIQNNTGEKAQ